VYRDDLEGRHHQPMNFQWGGSLDTLREVLAKGGWRTAAAIDPVSAMNWLAPEPVIDDMPVLPEVHAGQHQALLMIAPRPVGEALLTVVRLWPSGRLLTESDEPIWLGKAALLHVEDGVPLLKYLRSAQDHSAPLKTLTSLLQQSKGIEIRPVTRAGLVHDSGWQGQVLLAWE
jgi:undecaprenyl-diphosphatase